MLRAEHTRRAEPCPTAVEGEPGLLVRRPDQRRVCQADVWVGHHAPSVRVPKVRVVDGWRDMWLCDMIVQTIQTSEGSWEGTRR